MAASHADQHDKDKLARWHGDLAGRATGGFPLVALFLRSDADRAAHAAFRAYSSSSEELGAGFQHLVIFGQHGVSQAERKLLARLGLAADAIPSLVLLTATELPLVYALPLAPGDAGDEVESEAKDPFQVPWRQVLARVELEEAGAGDGGVEGRALDLGNIAGMSAATDLNQPLAGLVAGMLEQLD